MKLALGTGAHSPKALEGRSLLVALSLATTACLGALAGCGDDGTGVGGEGAGAQVEKNTTPVAGGLRRLTGTQMRYSVEYLLGPEAASLFVVWDDPQLHGFESIAAAELALGANDVSTLESVIMQQVTEAAIADGVHLASFAPCVTQSPGQACFAEVAERFGRVAWRRPLEQDEKDRLVAIANAGFAWGPQWGFDAFESGLQYQLSAILQSPNFVYISELGVKDGEHRRLGSYELAARMSFFLVHRTPDVELLDAAQNGQLDDAGIRAQARRLLLLPEARRSLDRFFGEYLLISTIAENPKDATKYPQWNAELALAMQEEMLRFLQDIVWTRNADAREIFNSTTTFVNPLLAQHYGVPGPASGWAAVTLPPEQQRSGILGKAGFLARFGHPTITSPTRRGRFFWEKLLCETIDPPPGNVDTTIPPDPPGQHQTMREKLAFASADPACSTCHLRMDPVGLAMEHFDSIGKYRADDEGLPIVTEGSYGTMSFASVSDLGNVLAADERATRCMVNNFLRQSMGHLETEGETAAIDALTQSFVDGGYRLQDLMVEMTLSPAFRLVAEPK